MRAGPAMQAILGVPEPAQVGDRGRGPLPVVAEHGRRGGPWQAAVANDHLHAGRVRQAGGACGGHQDRPARTVVERGGQRLLLHARRFHGVGEQQLVARLPEPAGQLEFLASSAKNGLVMSGTIERDELRPAGAQALCSRLGRWPEFRDGALNSLAQVLAHVGYPFDHPGRTEPTDTPARSRDVTQPDRES